MTWTAVAPLPVAMNSPGVTARSGKLYAFGGDSTNKKAAVYDPGTDTWTALADSNVGTVPPFTVAFYFAVTDLIYILTLNAGALRITYNASANTYSNSTWAAFIGMGMFAGACSDGTKMYALEYPVGSSDNLPQVSVFNPATNTWSTTGTKCPLAIAPNGLGYGSCWYHAGVIYYFDGWLAGVAPDGVVVKYTIATDTWATATTQPTPKEASVGTLTGVDKFPLIGGDNSGGNVAGVDIWDGSTWTSYTALSVATDGPGGEVCGSSVYVVGGFTSAATTNVWKAPLADFASGGGGTVSTGLTATRTARAFYAHPGPTAAAALHATRTARTFTASGLSIVSTAGGRPDADTAAGWGRLDREFSLTGDVDPPVDPPPAAHPSTLYRRASYSYTPPATAADGWSNPTQTRTLIDGSIVGRHRLRFNGIDRTFYRGVPALVLEDSHANPFGPETAVFHFQQVSPFETPPSWLNDGAKVVVTLVDGSNVTVPGWSWIGFVHNRTPELAADSWGTTVEAKGFLYQADDEINKPNPTALGGAAVPIGYRAADVLNSIIGRRFPRVARVDTSPSITRSRGSLSQTVAGFVRDLFGTAWTSDSRQWTALDVAGVMRAQIVLPDPTVVDYTLSAGQDDVTFDLHEEQDEQPNVVYGEWVDPNGGRHQRLKFPRLHEDKSPAYPLSVGSVFNPGAGTTGFQPFSDWMRRNGFSQFDSQDTYLASDEDDVRAAQNRMGITVDGIVGAQTWGTAFNTGADVGDLKNAVYLPLAWDTRVEPYLYAPDGAKVGKNPSYDPTVRRKETYINFGEGLTYREVRRSAQQIVTRNTTGTNLVGQITVTATDFEECSKLVARAGTTLRFRYLYGTGSTGVKFHMARIHRAYNQDGSVTATLDVDTKWRDAYTVAQIIERNKAARDDPARALRRHQTSSLTQDTKVQYDADDIGRIYRHNVQGGFWRIVEFPAASWGTWVHVTAVTAPATEFALMLFSAEVTARDLDRLVGNPLSSAHPYNAEGTALKAAGLIQAWGSSDQPAGYSKTNAATGYKSDSDPLTGRLEYDSSVDFAPANGSSLFLAEWCAASTVIHETFELQPVAV